MAETTPPCATLFQSYAKIDSDVSLISEDDRADLNCNDRFRKKQLTRLSVFVTSLSGPVRFV